MCGRITLFDSQETIEQRFKVSLDGLNFRTGYNIGPYTNVLTITRDEKSNKNQANSMYWNLIPAGFPKKNHGYRMFNARAQTIDTKRSFKRLIARNRCIIPINGFIEWDENTDPKEPYFVHLKSKEVLPCAGLWDKWEKDSEVVHSCTMITTDPNELLRKIHHRMPIILTPKREKEWLDPGNTDKEYIKSLLQQYDPSLMDMYRVPFEIGSTRNQGPELIRPVAV